MEQQADELLEKDRRFYTTSMGAYYFDILSEDQLYRRDEREMLTTTGNFDVALRPGCYYRAYNPRMGKRPCKARQFSLAQDPWRQHAYEFNGESGLASAWLPLARREEVTDGENWTIWPIRDPAGAIPTGQNYYHHLSAQQRCRIRSVLKAIPSTSPRAREAVKAVIAHQYGIPTWVVTRCLF